MTHVQLEDLRAIGVIEQSCEQAVVRSHKVVTVVFDDQDVTLGAYTRVDNRQMYAAGRKVLVGTAYPKSRFRWPLRWNVVREIDNSSGGEPSVNNALHDGGKRPLMAKVGRDRYDARWLHLLACQLV